MEHTRSISAPGPSFGLRTLVLVDVGVDVVGVVSALIISVPSEDVKSGSPAYCLLTFKADKNVDVEIESGKRGGREGRMGVGMWRVAFCRVSDGVGIMGDGVGVAGSELTSDGEGENLSGEEFVAVTEGILDVLRTLE